MNVLGRRTVNLLVALALAVSASAIPPPNRDDPPPPIGGGGGSCTYCTQTHCGCSDAPAGFRLDFSCSCSSVQCTRSCVYTAL